MLFVYQISLKTVHKNLRVMRDFMFGAKKKKNTKKFQGLVSQERLELFLSNLVCKVLYMKALKYVELVEIGAVVFEL